MRTSEYLHKTHKLWEDYLIDNPNGEDNLAKIIGEAMVEIDAVVFSKDVKYYSRVLYEATLKVLKGE